MNSFVINNTVNNTLVTGTDDGDDSILNYGANVTIDGGGNDTIENYSSEEDAIQVSGNVSSSIGGDNLVFTVGDTANAITLKDIFTGTDEATVKFVDSEGEEVSALTYFKDGRIVDTDSNAVSLTAQYTPTAYTDEDGTCSLIDASALNKAMSLTGGTDSSGVTIKGGTKDDTLTGNAADDEFTGNAADDEFTGNGGSDVFVYGGGNVTVNYSEKDKDKVSLGAGFEIVGVSDDDGITLALSKKDSLGEEVDGDYSLVLDGATHKTKVNLVTTEYVRDKKNNVKTKATSSTIYFADGMIRDSNVDAKVKKVTVFDGADFSELEDTGKNAKYKALSTITAAAEAEVVGTEKNNTIVLQAGGTATGGLGNDTFIIESGDAIVANQIIRRGSVNGIV